MSEQPGQGGGTAVATETKTKTKRPALYKVLLHNDDFTTMEFVVFILQTIFHKNPIDAHAILMAVHRAGVGVAGVYSYAIAEAKVNKVIDLAQAIEFPLRCSIEEE